MLIVRIILSCEQKRRKKSFVFLSWLFADARMAEAEPIRCHDFCDGAQGFACAFEGVDVCDGPLLHRVLNTVLNGRAARIHFARSDCVKFESYVRSKHAPFRGLKFPFSRTFNSALSKTVSKAQPAALSWEGRMLIRLLAEGLP